MYILFYVQRGLLQDIQQMWHRKKSAGLPSWEGYEGFFFFFFNLINSVFFWLEQLQQKTEVPLRPNLKISQQNMFCKFYFKARDSSFTANKCSSSGDSMQYCCNTITFSS